MGCSGSSSVKVSASTSAINSKTENKPSIEPTIQPNSSKNATSTSTKKQNDPNSGKIVQVENHWAIMPVLNLRAKLKTLFAEVKKKKLNPEDSMETLRTILKNISNNFEEEKYKSIRKANKRFNETIGQFPSGISLMQSLGFRDEEENVIFAPGLPRSHVMNKMHDLEIAYRKLNET
ncbi:unnamed protein product [Blepharisma stoltei]|uniref:PUB domain-containing protein n=1 Tax=Blepharisma stoltei TaxID=1481888 RepID=A0AAU9IUI7_9CILI|nr:unnamed protein product [Blepharisma stoltei]